MRTALLILLTSFSAIIYAQEFQTGIELLKYMQEQNKSIVPETFMCESNISDRQTGLKISAMEYFKCGDQHFQIFDADNGKRAKIYTKDSLIIYLRNDIVYMSQDLNLEGFFIFGIHQESIESVLVKLKSIGIDVNIIGETIRFGRPVWIIGSEERDHDIPQIWIDKEYLVVRRLHYLNPFQDEVQQIEWEDFQSYNGFHIPEYSEVKNEPFTYLRIKRINGKINEEIPQSVKKLEIP